GSRFMPSCGVAETLLDEEPRATESKERNMTMFDELEQCNVCGGSRRIDCTVCADGSNFCSVCGGKGTVICFACHGTGLKDQVLADDSISHHAGETPAGEPPASYTEGFADASGSSLADMAKEIRNTKHLFDQLHADAKQAADVECDYPKAAELLEKIPAEQRDAELHVSVSARRDLAASLEQSIGQAASDDESPESRAKISLLLTYLPERTDLRERLERLPPREAETLTNSLDMRFARAPAGEFLMGGTASPTEVARLCEGQTRWFAREHPLHLVRLARPFFLGVIPVAQAEYEQVVGENPSWFMPTGKGREKVRGLDSGRLPVECVSWRDAEDFCRLLSELPAEQEAGRAYRLPTEAEWEYACRAGTATAFHQGDAISSEQANFNGKRPFGDAAAGPFLQRTAPVGSHEPNAWGFRDMHGNVWEWCSDWHSTEYYGESPTDDPAGPERGFTKVVRGGSWDEDAHFCRCANRYDMDPDTKFNRYGIRLVCEVSPAD
ncbi:MAG: SUMF1/EgtB/PvdO family nonheme iron enzyme, partial [Planctomycetales bacterium]